LIKALKDRQGEVQEAAYASLGSLANTTSVFSLNLALAEQLERSLQSVDLVLDEAASLAAAYAMMAETRGTGKTEITGKAVHLQLQQLIAGLPQIRGLAIADANGIIVNDTFTFPLSRIDVGDREHFTYPRDHAAGTGHISAPHKSRRDKDWTVVMSRRIKSADGVFRGTVFARVHPPYFQELYRSVLPKPGSSVSVFRSDAVHLLRYPHSDQAVGKTFTQIPLFRDQLFLKESHGFFESDSPFDGKQRLVSYIALKQHPLLVNVTLDKEVLLADWTSSSLRMAMMALAVSVLLLLLMFALVELFRRQEQIAAEVRDSEQRLRLITDNMNDVVWTAAADMHLTYVSPSVERLRGFTVEEALQQTPGQILAPASFKKIRTMMQEMFDSAARGEIQGALDVRFEVEQTCKNGATLWMEESIRLFFSEEGQFLGMQGVARPICERKRLEDELRLLANTDTLTGLANRRAFLARLDQEVARAHRYGHPLAILMLDIDHFKTINDRYGHPAGDEALRRFAAACQAVLRCNDVLARMGGEEFAAFLPETGLDGARLTGERIRQAVEELAVVYAGERFHFTTSIGIVLLHDQHDGEHALQLADKALYLAKSRGRNRVVVYEENLLHPAQPMLI